MNSKKYKIVIGLPCSGKSHLLQKMNSKGYVIYDDFITSLCDGKLYKSIKENELICIADPRLCNYDIFSKYIIGTFEPEKTQLIIFDNDPEKCILNIDRPNKQRWVNTILNMSKHYDVNKYPTYFDIKRIVVYSKDELS